MIKVLIIDDEPLVRMGMKSIISWEEHGYTIVGEAGNGQQGLEKILNLCPDLVLIDIMMPQMDGLAVITEAKQKGFMGKFIILSCVSEFEYLQKAIRLGVSDYVLKSSVTPREILETVEEASRELQKDCPKEFTELLQNREHYAFHEFLNLILKKVITDVSDIDAKMKVFGYKKTKNVYLLVSRVRDNTDAARKALYRMVSVGESMLEEYWGTCFVDFKDCLVLLMSADSRKEAEETAFRLQASARQYFDVQLCTEIQKIDAAEWNIVSQYEEAEGIQQEALNKEAEKDALISDMKQYIKAHCHSRLSTRDVAEHVHFSVDYTSKYFKEKTQITLTDYILNLKVQCSCTELLEGKSVAEIADIYGFSSAGHYLKVFKRYEGMTPGAYVKENRKR